MPHVQFRDPNGPDMVLIADKTNKENPQAKLKVVDAEVLIWYLVIYLYPPPSSFSLSDSVDHIISTSQCYTDALAPCMTQFSWLVSWLSVDKQGRNTSLNR